MEQDSKKKSSGKKLRTSQLSFNLPKELHAELQSQLKEAKARENTANEKMRELLEKEKKLATAHKELEEEKTEFRTQMQEQMAVLQKRFEESKKLSDNETTRLIEELAENNTQCEVLRTDRDTTLENYQKKRARLENEFSNDEEEYREKFNAMTERMRVLDEDEREFLERKKTDQDRARKKERFAKKNAAEHAKGIREMEALLKDAERTNRRYKSQLDKEFKAKTEKLEKEFDEKSRYHTRRLDETWNNENQVENEREALKVKEQSLALEVQKKGDEHAKARQAELDKRDADLVKMLKKLTEQEQALNKQRKTLLKTLKIPRGGKFAASQLNVFAQEEEQLLRDKKLFLKSIKKLHVPNEELLQARLEVYERQKNEAIAKLGEERKKLKKERGEILKKEKKLIRREAEELQHLNEEYEEFRGALEIKQIEQSSELAEMQDKIREEEQKLIVYQRKLEQTELEAAQRIKEHEDLVIEELEEVQETRATLFLKQLNTDTFLNNFQTTYKNRLELQTSEYGNFKKKLDSLKTEAEKTNQSLQQKGETLQEESAVTEEATSKRLKYHETMIDTMEKELRSKAKEYHTYITELQKAKKEVFDKDKTRETEYLDNLTHYEEKLLNLGKAFEDLSQAFQAEKESGRVEVIDDSDERKYKASITKDGDVAKLEWPLAIRYKLDPDSMNIDTSMLTEYLDIAAENWDEWIDVPPGEYKMGDEHSRKSASLKKVKIKKPLLIGKYPLTNAQFYQFVLASGYKTQAEQAVNGIVYHDGKKMQMDSRRGDNRTYCNPSLNPEESAAWFRPDGQPESLFEKHNHPVTQVTWNDATAYCRWKSEDLGKTVRLPWESEWEYVAKNFGKLLPEKFYWDEDNIKGFCNIEETGIGGTTAVDHFPEQEMGAHDLFGNVYEWVMDSQDETLSNPARKSLAYKMVRGGSYITNYQHIAPWRRLPFVINYCTSFLGFRVVIEES